MARRPVLPTREKRLQAISAWLGTADALSAEFAAGTPPQRVRTFSQAAPDDLAAALAFLGGIAGVGIVVHGPRGCAAALVESAPAAHWAVTGLDQRDTIMGSEGALSRSILALYRRHHPWAVFVVTTPVVAINGDDARATADALSAELDIPVVVVAVDGFRSRVAATGSDAASDAALRLVPPPAGPVGDFVNLLTLDAGRAAEAAALLASLGLGANVLPAGADAGRFVLAARARFSVALDPDATERFGLGLEAAHGVKLLRQALPIGLEATRHWLEVVAAGAGHPPPERRLHEARLEALGQPLAGLRVHLALPPAAAFAGAVLVGELGGTVARLSVDHVDAGHVAALRRFAEDHPGAVLHVAHGQPFEHANLLGARAADLFIGRPELAALAARLGVPAVGIAAAALVGYQGAEYLVRQARKARANPAFVRRLAATAPTYSAAWLRRSADWHIKQEVR
ncbi:Nitrogen fixation protein NifE [Rhodovastum atsumiense]|uniref:Nitrogen fixation protein NifE n=1 Tax=Rhodovastum atsumiense TaxID=504468 RepID=A0A5M6IXP7_9PROT|nr:nitrogenase component 1 [Rhodovastum atsumiense]KAA5612607.1 nitrogen fixation protein NifE [Rhodovastum atsumiense]CAH2601294.1 Nitrogen fixation protein NifE [Rhodovastum atsumiense]